MSNRPKNTKRPWVYFATDYILSIAGALSLFVGVLAAFRSEISIGPVFLGAGLVLMLAGTIDRFESIKGLGMEAKGRTLDRKIEEADDALQRLRELAELTCETVITLSSNMGRWDSYQTQSSGYSLAVRVSGMLSSVGSDQGTIQKALKPYALVACRDASAPLVERLRNLVRDRLNAVNTELGILSVTVKPDDPRYQPLMDERSTLGQFLAALDKSIPMSLDAFPDAFLKLFEDVPLVTSTELEALRSKTLTLKDGMESLSRRSTLPDAAGWFKAVEDAAKPDPSSA